MKIEVVWYSGYKNNERPKSFIINGKKYIVQKVLQSKLIEDYITGDRKQLFIVQTDSGIYKLQYDGNDWQLIK